MLQARASNFMRMLVLSLFVLLLGCSDSGMQKERIPLPTNLNTDGIISTQTANATMLTTTTSVFIPLTTPSKTVIPISTKTPRPMISPTWTPVSTLLSDKALAKLLSLYADNGGCELPCWWGITPGKTTWQTARETLFSMGSVYGPIEKEGVSLYEPEYIVPKSVDPLGYIWPVIWVKDDVVLAIGTNSGWIEPDFDYSLAGFLSSLGAPDEIWLKIITDSMSKPYYEMRLFYKERGIEIGATGEARINGNKLNLCPKEFKQGEFPPGILLWAPSDKVNFKNMNSFLGNLTNRNSENFYPLEDLTEEFDTMTFYKTFHDPSSRVCLDFELTNLP
jgi:hypothetical protein